MWDDKTLMKRHCNGGHVTPLIIKLNQLRNLKWLTHCGRLTRICVNNLTIIGKDNGLSPGRCQANVWTNAGRLLNGPLRTNYSEILIEIHAFSINKMHLNLSSAKWQPFCLGLNMLTVHVIILPRQYWMHLNLAKSHKLQWNFNQDKSMVIQENVFGNVVSKISQIFHFFLFFFYIFLFQICLYRV